MILNQIRKIAVNHNMLSSLTCFCFLNIYIHTPHTHTCIYTNIYIVFRGFSFKISETDMCWYVFIHVSECFFSTFFFYTYASIMGDVKWTKCIFWFIFNIYRKIFIWKCFENRKKSKKELGYISSNTNAMKGGLRHFNRVI